MADQSSRAYAGSALRALTYRIASTQPTQLPRYVSGLAASVWTCQDILSTSVDKLKADGDLSVAVHRFKTQLTALLQDRTVEGRWSAVVLVKTAIEAGGAELLSKSNAWVRSLLAILKKPDPSTTRVLAVLTLTRIFMLTWDYSNLIREITTPALPTFVSTCLSNVDNVRCTSEELQSILESFKVLIPHHPTIFRTNEAALTAFLLKVISSSAQPDTTYYTPEHISTAQALLVLLALSVPKQGGASRWEEDLQSVIRAAHETSDIIFTPIIEIWRSNIEAFQNHASVKQILAPIERSSVDAFKLNSWKGIYAGAERLGVLLDQIKAYIENVSPATINLRLGVIVDLLSRLSAVIVPGPDKQTAVQANSQIAKEERDALFAVLPRIHSRMLQLLDTLVQRLDAVMIPALPAVLEILVAVFAAESFDTHLRTTAYALLKTVLERAGPSLSKDEVADLAVMISSCCNDCQIHLQTKHEDQAASKKQADLVLSMAKTEAGSPVRETALRHGASTLLPLLLLQIDAGKITRRLRTQLDRTAILTRNKHALLASVLNPAPSSSGHGLQSSLLPFLARLFPNDPEVEGLIRPRMPFAGAVDTGDTGGEDEDDDIDDEMDDVVPELDAMDNDDVDEDDGSIPSPATASHGAKHALEQDVPDSDSKRARHATASSQIQSEWQAALATTAPAPVQTVQPLADRTSIALTSTAEPVDLSDDAGSDFEMPPLTMDSDSEDEAEE